MHTKPRCPRYQWGQALIESLVASGALILLGGLLIILGRYQSVDLAAVGAARTLAFECATVPQRCGVNEFKHTAAVLRAQHFTNEADSLQMLHPWTTRQGQPLLEKAEHAQITLARLHFGAGIGAISTGAASKAGSALRTVSKLAGPNKFGLDLVGGLLAAQVQIDLLKNRGPSTPELIYSGMPLSPTANNAILSDAWNASGPYGKAATTVETRVNKGKRLASAIETAHDAAYFATKSLIKLSGYLQLEDRADDFKHHEIDMDVVPPDRLGR